MKTAKERILANYEQKEGTFYQLFTEKDCFDQEKFTALLADVHQVTNALAGKPLDRELAVALNAMQTYLFESCMYHAQEEDNYVMETYPGIELMTNYLDAMKYLVTQFYLGENAIKPLIDAEGNPQKVLIFTTIEKSGYRSDIKTEEATLTEEFQEFIEAEYGMEKDNMLHASIYASEAMNGDELYIELVSESQAALEEVKDLIQLAGIRTRHELEQWVHRMDFVLLAADGDIDQVDEYLIAV